MLRVAAGVGVEGGLRRSTGDVWLATNRCKVDEESRGNKGYDGERGGKGEGRLYEYSNSAAVWWKLSAFYLLFFLPPLFFVSS